MGKGDRKTRRGKIFRKSFGNTRPRRRKRKGNPAGEAPSRPEPPEQDGDR